MDINIPDVAFVGICDRAEQVCIGPKALWYDNILGLRNKVFTALYPFSLSNFKLVLAIYDFQNFPEARISIRTEEGREIFGYQLGKISTPLEEGQKVYMQRQIEIPRDYPVWSLTFSDMPDRLINVPEQYTIYLVRGDEEFTLGVISFELIEIPPFSEDRIAAMRSNPSTPKAAWMEIFCKDCGDKLKAYCSLDRDDDKMGGDFTWYKDAPDEFRCQCGNTVIPLRILKRNLHYLLIKPVSSIKEVSSAKQYEKDALNHLYYKFVALLDTNPGEPEVFKFVKENPLLLHLFSPDRTFYKPPMTTKFKTDIVILNKHKELILIELESPGKQILKLDGGIHHETQHAFQQVRDWLYEIKRNRLGALDCIPLKLEEVTKERGYVIIGRDKNCNEEHLFKQRSADLEVELLTYDDLLKDLAALIRDFEHL